MGSVRVISTTTIHARSHNKGEPAQKVDLNPWDLQLLPLETMQDGLLFHHHHPVDPSSDQIQHLQHSLSSTLAFFPPFAGRLVITKHEDNTASCFIACNNLGALFVHAAAENTSVADILRPDNVPAVVSSFFPLNGIKNFQGTSKPLLAVQVTELLDGIFIGCTTNHVAADGKSFWHFVNSWAEISRGCHGVSKLPVLQRWFLKDIDRPIRFPFTIEAGEESLSLLHPPERIFPFTKEKIAQLKSKANAEAGTDNIISSLQALLTHVWRSVIRCKRLDAQKEVCYVLPIGLRPRMIPPLPEDYFGNAGLPSGVIVKAGELLEEGGLGKVAWEMSRKISSHSDEKIKSHYESWLRTPRLFSQGRVTSSDDFALATSRSARFDVYGNDFGWGKPVAVRCGNGNRRYGMIAVLAGAEEGSIDVAACLPCEILEALGNDPEFMDVVSH